MDPTTDTIDKLTLKIQGLESEIEDLRDELSNQEDLASEAGQHYEKMCDFFDSLAEITQEASEAWRMKTPEQALKEIDRLVALTKEYQRYHG